MLLSLQWVRDNIRRFGGDPNNVMIFGESGGGAKVSTLMAMPQAAGLFHKAAVQSGSALSVSTPEVATANAKKLLAALGLSESEVDKLATLPMEQLRGAASTAGVDFRPVVDNRSLPRQPFDPDAPRISAHVPMLIGTTKDENTLLIGNRDPSTWTITAADLPTKLAPYLEGANPVQVISAYKRLYPKASPSELFFSITSTRGFRTRAWAQAERKAALGAAPAYLYQLDWETPVDGGKWKSPHALEIGFVFDNVAKSESMSGVGREQQKLADAMSSAWLRFARTGNPGWPAYEPKRRATMVFDTRSRVENDWGRAERLLFADVPPLRRQGSGTAGR
jgi:para-nitrobenzyl esterase